MLNLRRPSTPVRQSAAER